VIIGNPPYNVGQLNENDNNKNRKYPVIDRRIHDTYAKDSKATNKNALSDAYVKFFRWATDRLDGRDGIVCFVSNNSFVDQIAFDGMRKHLMQDFTHIDHIDLHGNVRKNPKLSGTTHNVFGIQVGVGITVAVRCSGEKRLRYHRVPEFWRKEEKLAWLDKRETVLENLSPDASHTWLVPSGAAEFQGLVPVAEILTLHSRGIATCRDGVVYDFQSEPLAERVQGFVEDYNAEVDRYRRAGAGTDVDQFVRYDRIKWSETLKLNLRRGVYAAFERTRIRPCLYRPFTMRFVYFDRGVVERLYQFPRMFPQCEADNRLIWLKVGSEWPMFALAAKSVVDLLPQGGSSASPSTLTPPTAPTAARTSPTPPSKSSARTTATPLSPSGTSSTTSTPSCTIRRTGRSSRTTSNASCRASPSLRFRRLRRRRMRTGPPPRRVRNFRTVAARVGRESGVPAQLPR